MDSPPVADLAPQGVLRAAINLGNPVLAQGTASDPRGVTVELARALAERLGVPLEMLCFDAARDSFAALTDGRADVGFLAAEPARAEQVRFSAPYVLIEGVACVPADSDLHDVADLDRPQVRIGVKEGSAYDLYLSRTLERAALVRGNEGVEVFLEQGLEAGAGIRQPVTAFVDEQPGVRLLSGAFMQIRQAVAVPRDRSDAAAAWLHDVVEELKGSGLVAQALAGSGHGDLAVAPPEARPVG